MAIAVYCGSSLGNNKAFTTAAHSVGRAIAKSNSRLVYGGGGSGLMGIVSAIVLEAGGTVTGVVPYQMIAGGGEGDKGTFRKIEINSFLRTKPYAISLSPPHTWCHGVPQIVVDSMHERKVEMAKRVDAFIGLPGGFGTFEEVFEATTWTQLGIHAKPVILVNVLGFYNPLREQIKLAIDHEFIHPRNKDLIIFVDEVGDDFDWGEASLEAIRHWHSTVGVGIQTLFDWTLTKDGARAKEKLSAT